MFAIRSAIIAASITRMIMIGPALASRSVENIAYLLKNKLFFANELNALDCNYIKNLANLKNVVLANASG